MPLLRPAAGAIKQHKTKPYFLSATRLYFVGVNIPRRKRSVLEFASLIEYWTGQSALTFNDYGCYCGSGGEGRTVDDLDA